MNVDYYQGVVVDYLRADRTVFVNTECCIQLHEGRTAAKNEHWYCDALAIDLRGPTVFLCEVSYANGLNTLLRRLKMWAPRWDDVRAALVRDSRVDPTWNVRPWLFVPKDLVKCLVRGLASVGAEKGVPFEPRITTLESAQPWRYTSWDHQDALTDKSDTDIPLEMRV